MRLPSRPLSRFLVPLCLLCLPALPALADITLGADARSVAMGGAGLASGDSATSGTVNPASLADTGMRFNVQWPSISTRMTGASYADALSLIGSPSLDADDALDLAVSLGKNDVRLDASASAGLLLPKADLQAKASIRTQIIPNEEFKTWARNGGDGMPPVGAEAQVYAGGLATLPSLGVGFHLPVDAERTGRISLGVRIKPTTAYYSHYVIDSTAVTTGASRRSAEMGDRDYLKQNSFSADLGVMYSLPRLPEARLAVVVNNLIEPKAVTFSSMAPDGLFEKQLAPRSISAGAAFVNDHLTLAADLVDVTKAYGDPQVRLGAELRTPGGLFALRGGYNTSTGFTAGIGVGGFGIAYSKRSPIMLSHNIAF